MEENPEPHWKRDVAVVIGTDYRDESFIKLVQRRRNDGQIKVTHGGDKIQWVNRAWQRSIIPLQAGEAKFLDFQLPFGAEKYIAIPEHSEIVVGGDINSGKTHFGYLIAELNIGKMPIRHFVSEIGGQKAIRNLKDFPKLLESYGDGYHLIDIDKENLEVMDNLDADGLNIYDYLHLSDSKEWFLTLQRKLAILAHNLNRGIAVVMLQKKGGADLAMGGESTKMQCDIYFTLNIKEKIRGTETAHGFIKGRVDIVKAKYWATNTCPEGLCGYYKTAPMYGKLVQEENQRNKWVEKPVNEN